MRMPLKLASRKEKDIMKGRIEGIVDKNRQRRAADSERMIIKRVSESVNYRKHDINCDYVTICPCIYPVAGIIFQQGCISLFSCKGPPHLFRMISLAAVG